jgi:hypothetical protein
MAEIVALPGAGPRADVLGAPPVPAVVERIEQLLALARAGEIRALAYVYVDPRGGAFDAWVSCQDEPVGHSLVAGVAYLHHNIVAEKCAAPGPPEREPA